MNKRLGKHYVNPTAEIKNINIENKDFRICKLPADLALRLSIRLGTTVAPLIPLLGKEQNILEALPKLNIDDEKLSDLVIDVCQMCQTFDKTINRDRMIEFDRNDIIGIKMPFLLAFEFLKFNFENFFADSPLAQKVAEKAGGINLGEMMK
jgi:hypothetical protein